MVIEVSFWIGKGFVSPVHELPSLAYPTLSFTAISTEPTLGSDRIWSGSNRYLLAL